MVSEKQWVANRENAKLGRANTVAGKKFPGAMPTTRCILSKQAYIDGEDPYELNRLRRNMMAEDQPRGEWETLQMDRMVACS